MSSIIIFMGATGAGKSMMARRLCQDYGYQHISSGELLRQHSSQDLDLARGQLVDAKIVETLVAAALTKSLHEYETVVLDGFPRDASEAQWLANWTGSHNSRIKAVVWLTISRKLSQARLDARGRSDDSASTFNRKWAQYKEQTMPVVREFQDTGLIREVSAEGSPHEVYERIIKVLTP